ncbi:MAG TPA: CHASE3 domain-containing protein [Acidimicrobiales bacterium]|nr:CHASE3 domain-containing protein [Acidimicrobiales bacterium]
MAPDPPARHRRRGRPGSGWPLRARLMALLAAVGVLLVATSAVQLALQAHQRDVRNHILDDIDPARVATADFRAAAVDQETAVRGFALTGDESFLAPYDDGGRAADAALARVRRLVGDEPGINREIDALAGRIDRWRSEIGEPSQDTTAAGRARARSDAFQDQGKRLFDEVRQGVAVVDTRLAAMRASSLRELDDAARNATVAMLLQAVGLVASGIIIVVALARVVVGPIERLGRDARVVASGDLDHVVAGDGSPDLARLGADVDAMRRRIVGEVELLNAASADLARQAEDLARSNDDLEQFAYVASHDLQEPLRKVSGFCQLLQMRYADRLDERANEYIHYAVDGAKRMQDLINDLLAFSRVGRTTESFEPVDLGELTRDVVEVLGPAIEDTGATVTVGDLPTVDGDRRLLAATVQNLVSNALKFRSEAPPRIAITATLCDGAAGDGDGEWVIEVADNGIGIDPDYGEQIFTIFKRLHSKTEYAGTGIGLALSKKIVEFHGGRIWLEPTTPPGATFRLALPRSAPPPTERDPAHAG